MFLLTYILIIDLKKLIKYDLQHRNEGESLSTRTQKSESVGCERLHSASTFSSRNRSKVTISNQTCTRGCQSKRKVINLQSIHSAPTISHQKEEIITSRRACSCVRPEKPEKKPGTSKETPRTTYSHSCKFNYFTLVIACCVICMEIRGEATAVSAVSTAVLAVSMIQGPWATEAPNVYKEKLLKCYTQCHLILCFPGKNI